MFFLADKLTKQQITKRRWLIAAVMNIGLIMVVMSVSSVNVIIPTLASELQATATELQWIVDSYALVFAGLLLPLGAVGDKFGRRRAFIAGLLVFALSSYLSAYAGSATELIIWRGLMGVGAALVMPATLSIITNVFPAKDRPKAVAMWAGFAGFGAAIGPLVAGLLLEYYWWGAVFLALIPVIAVTILLTMLFVPTSKDPHEPKLDFVGSFLSIAALGALLFGIIEAPNVGWVSGITIASAIIAVAATWAFIWWENRVDEPMLPMKYFKIPNFSMGSLMITLMFFSMFGLFFIILQYLQFVLGLSALEAAIWILPMAATFVFISPLGPFFAKIFNQRIVSGLGILVTSIGFFIFAQLTPESNFFPEILAGLLVMGSGMALAMTLATDAIISSVPKRKAGVGSAVNDTTREVGGALGIAVLGSLLSSGYREAIEGEVAVAGELAEQTEESIGGALRSAQEIGGEGAVQLVNAANQAFVDGMSFTFIVGGAILIFTGVIVLRYMPDDLTDTHHQEEKATSE